MSEWLVDTHAVLWFLTDDPRLSAPAKATMESPYVDLVVSAATVWEIGIKTAFGKLSTDDDLPEVLSAQGFRELPLSSRDGWAVRELPLGDHEDPFDRVIAAQALRYKLPIISNDAAFDRYGVTRHW